MRAFSLIAFLFSILYTEAQTATLLFESFFSYDGTSVAVPAGWNFTYNGNYTSSSYSGNSGPNAYKFGTNNAAITTPAFSNADTVSFWIKGASTDAISSLSVYETSDSVTWTNISVINPLSTSGIKYKFHVQPNSVHLKFVYTKSAGNLAFDDFLLTGSKIPGAIKVYFNRPVNNFVSNGMNAIYLDSTLDDTLVSYINRAHYSIDAAVYNFLQSSSIADIAGAINRAYARGVNVRWIYDGTTSNTGVPLLDTNIKRLKSPATSSYNIMHNKFMVIDAKSENYSDPIVWTGSTNWGKQQFYDDVNNAITLQDRNLAFAYTTEFNEMWGDTGLVPDTLFSKFGQYKTNNTPHAFVIGGKMVELYFSPSDNVNSHILQTISSANTEMYFGLYTVTLTADGDSIKNKIQNGIYSAGIMDQNSVPFTPYTTLNPLMGNLLKVFSGSFLYHNKLLIVDACNPYSDPLVLTGSHNWTSLADTKNDENTLIIHDDTIANIYYQSFYQNFYDLGGTLASCAVTGTNEQLEEEINIFPNPSNGVINVLMSKYADMQIKLYNTFGQCTYQHICTSAYQHIDLSSQPNGIYFLQTEIGGKHFTSKLIIQH